MAVEASDLAFYRRTPQSLRVPLAMAIMLLVVVAVFAFWLRASEASHLTLSVSGARGHVPRRAIAAAVAPYLNTGFFGVNLEGIQHAVEVLPWVAQAQVHRRWPGSVDITVHERHPMARWGDESLIAASGERFTPAPDTLPKNLPHLNGPQGSEQKLLDAYEHIRGLLKPTPYQLKALWINQRGAWRAKLSPALVLRLGRNHVMQRVTRFAGPAVNALGSRLDQAAYVDLRYSNGFAVGWKQKQEDGQ